MKAEMEVEMTAEMDWKRTGNGPDMKAEMKRKRTGNESGKEPEMEVDMGRK